MTCPANIVGGGYGPAVGSTYWSESFLRKADGALAVIGDTRSSSTVDNNHLTMGLFDAIFPGLAPGFGPNTPIRRLGDVLNHARSFISAVGRGQPRPICTPSTWAVCGRRFRACARS